MEQVDKLDDEEVDDAKDQSVGDAVDQSTDEHLAGVDDGCGCAEVWEHLSEQRADD